MTDSSTLTTKIDEMLNLWTHLGIISAHEVRDGLLDLRLLVTAGD